MVRRGGVSIRIRRILCPTDFSEFAVHAIHHAAAVARAWGADLVTLHVMPQTLMHPELLPDFDKPLVPRPDIEEHTRARLEAFGGEASAAGVVPENRLVAGDPRLRIVAEAEKTSADLIVLGTHGRGGVQRFLLGSVAERVVRGAAVPVLTVGAPPPATSLPEKLPYRRILAALDFSPSSMLALDHAVAFWRKAEGELLVVHVVEPGGGGAPRARVEEALGSRAGDVEGAEVIVVEGASNPGREIRRISEERDVHLTVAGGTGAGTIDPAETGFLGTTVEALLRASGRPVLTVRPRFDVTPKEGN